MSVLDEFMINLLIYHDPLHPIPGPDEDPGMCQTPRTEERGVDKYGEVQGPTGGVYYWTFRSNRF